MLALYAMPLAAVCRGRCASPPRRPPPHHLPGTGTGSVPLPLRPTPTLYLPKYTSPSPYFLYLYTLSTSPSPSRLPTRARPRHTPRRSKFLVLRSKYKSYGVSLEYDGSCGYCGVSVSVVCSVRVRSGIGTVGLWAGCLVCFGASTVACALRSAVLLRARARDV